MGEIKEHRPEEEMESTIEPDEMSMDELIEASKNAAKKILENSNPDDSLDTNNKYTDEIEKRRAVNYKRLKKYKRKGFGSEKE